MEIDVWYDGKQLDNNELMNYIQSNSKDLVFEITFEEENKIVKEKDIMYKEKRGFISITKERIAKEKIKEFKMYYDSVVSKLDELCDENIPTAENPETINE